MVKYSLKNDGAKKLTSNITVSDFLKIDSYGLTAAQKATYDEVIVSEVLVGLIKELEVYFANYYSKTCKIKLTPHGGYRPENLNKKVGGAKNSQHRKGIAADIIIVIDNKPLDVPIAAVITENYMQKRGFCGGVGVYASSNKHFHIDVRGGWASWYCSYNGAGTPAQGGRKCTFKKGNKAAGIVLIQRELIKLKYQCTADGVFGEKTEKALIAFQNDHKLVADGIYGEKTNALLKALPW